MTIPLSTRCLAPTISRDIVDRFAQSSPADKDDVICDVMSIWDLIVDCFNEHNHYAALSILYDLVQQQKCNGNPNVLWKTRSDIADKVAVQAPELQRLINSEMYSVKLRADEENGFIFLVADIVENSSYDEWIRHDRHGSAPVVWHFRFKVIDDVDIARIWISMRWAFSNIDFMDWRKAVKALNSAADLTLNIEERFGNFQLLAQMAGNFEYRFKVNVTETTSDSRLLIVEFVFNDVPLFYGKAQRNSDFGKFMWTSFGGITSPDEAARPTSPPILPFNERARRRSTHQNEASRSGTGSTDIVGGGGDVQSTDLDPFEDGGRPEPDPDSEPIREHKRDSVDLPAQRPSGYADFSDDVNSEHNGLPDYVRAEKPVGRGRTPDSDSETSPGRGIDEESGSDELDPESDGDWPTDESGDQ